MKIWAIANQKGGVGKTTTAVTLGGLLAARGHATLLVDLDPHGSLSAYFGLDPDGIPQSVYQLFQDGAEAAGMPQSAIRATATERLFLLPASSAMATLDRQLGAREGMGLVLARSLSRVAGRYDFALLDCPPTLGVLMVNALGACDRLLIPVQTEFLALKGLERMLHTLAMIQRARHTVLDYTIVPTMFDRRTHAAQEALAELQHAHAARLWPGAIPIDTQLREAARAGSPLTRAARSVIAYTALLDHLLADTKAQPVTPAASMA